ncbi:uncharacterized protein Tco025E_02887 [Trypanosoma conorhini]|uniref:DNA polymerase beta thumb domain-containing protein n=1 Tax=Trypanosoma conorhini TaxID=83891 RepID=A0A3R7MZW3_9TRYP|nr:uncharacterized protein Tco025E_02887 [Trypanosoma conorhini]RNF23139.1 hypothetical protein Tco025E_02887 [Trypanosoma conorhini]
MPPPSRLCALHGSNHLVVQELMLHAALGRRDFPSRERQDYVTLAQHIAQLPGACAEFFARHHPQRGVSAKSPWHNAAARQVVFERLVEQRGGDHSFCAGQKIPVCYDDAVEHQLAVERLLGPHGFRVALIGAMRRGCPVGRRATFLLTHDAQGGCGELLPSRGDPDASEAILFERAMRGLATSGYVRGVAGRNTWACGGASRRCVCLARVPREYGPQLPPRAGQEEEEQELAFMWAPSRSFHARRLFLTGPKPFLTHLMLVADARECELTQDGLYRRSPGARTRLELRGEKDIFTALQLPYVDPLHRYAYCRLHKLL